MVLAPCRWGDGDNPKADMYNATTVARGTVMDESNTPRNHKGAKGKGYEQQGYGKATVQQLFGDGGHGMSGKGPPAKGQEPYTGCAASHSRGQGPQPFLAPAGPLAQEPPTDGYGIPFPPALQAPPPSWASHSGKDPWAEGWDSGHRAGHRPGRNY